MTTTEQVITVILVLAVPVGIWLVRTFLYDPAAQRRAASPAVSWPPAHTQTANDDGLGLPLVGFVVWLVVVVVVGLTALRLAWKVFQFAWS